MMRIHSILETMKFEDSKNASNSFNSPNMKNIYFTTPPILNGSIKKLKTIESSEKDKNRHPFSPFGNVPSKDKKDVLSIQIRSPPNFLY
jgi:hypothetical protein